MVVTEKVSLDVAERTQNQIEELKPLLSDDVNIFSDGSAADLQALISLAEEHGFRLYLGNGPTWDGLENDSVFMEYRAKLNVEYAAFAAQSHHVVYLDHVSTFGLEFVEERQPDHFVVDVADEFTLNLIEQIQDAESEFAMMEDS